MNKVLLGLTILALSTFATVGASIVLSLGFFGLTTLLGIIAFAASLTILTWLVYNIVGWCATQLFFYLFFPDATNPGILVMTVLCIAAGIIAPALLGAVVHGVLLASLLGVFLYSLINTGLFWLFWSIGVRHGKLPAVKTFWPV